MTMPFEMSFAAAPESLKRSIMGIWLIRSSIENLKDCQRADIPYLQFFLAGGGRMQFAAGHTDATYPVSLVCLCNGAAQYELEGPLVLFGCSLTAYGWAAYLQTDASLFADRITDASSLLGAGVVNLHQQLQEMAVQGTSVEEMGRALEAFLAARAGRVSARHHHIIDATQAWIESSLCPRLEDLYRDLPVGQRQAIRIIRRYFGAPPQLLLRRARALRVAALLVESTDDQRTIKDHAIHFYDQAHMIHEIKNFTGRTPGALKQLESELYKASLDTNLFKEMGVDIAALASKEDDIGGDAEKA